MRQVAYCSKSRVMGSRGEFGNVAAQTLPNLFGKLYLSCARACHGRHDQCAILVQIYIGMLNTSNLFACNRVHRNKAMKFVAQCVESRGHNV